MKQKIDIFLPAESIADIMPMLDKLNKERMIDSIFMISSTEEETMENIPANVKIIKAYRFRNSPVCMAPLLVHGPLYASHGEI